MIVNVTSIVTFNNKSVLRKKVVQIECELK